VPAARRPVVRPHRPGQVRCQAFTKSPGRPDPSPSTSSASAARTPTPPALPTTAIRRPAGRGCSLRTRAVTAVVGVRHPITRTGDSASPGHPAWPPRRYAEAGALAVCDLPPTTARRGLRSPNRGHASELGCLAERLEVEGRCGTPGSSYQAAKRSLLGRRPCSRGDEVTDTQADAPAMSMTTIPTPPAVTRARPPSVASLRRSCVEPDVGRLSRRPRQLGPTTRCPQPAQHGSVRCR
jgi:hypothetical protein